MVAHRTQFSASDSFQSLLHNISTMINTSMAYADIPINHIQNALGMSADEGLLFDVFIHIHSNNALNGALKTLRDKTFLIVRSCPNVMNRCSGYILKLWKM